MWHPFYAGAKEDEDKKRVHGRELGTESHVVVAQMPEIERTLAEAKAKQFGIRPLIDAMAGSRLFIADEN